MVCDLFEGQLIKALKPNETIFHRFIGQINVSKTQGMNNFQRQ